MDELNDTQQVEVGDQQYTGDLSDLVQDETAVEAAPSGENFEQDVAPESESGPEPSSFSALDAELGELEELQHDGFYEKITEDHIKDLPPTARRILHNFRVDRKLAQDKHVTELEELKSTIEKREQNLSDMEREFSKRQAEFANLVEDPEVQKLLSEPDGEMPDIFTEEGVEARIQRGIAKGMSAILEPMKHAADVKARENNYLEFVDQHPEMRDAPFKKDVAGLVQEQRARQQSARRIGRAVSGGNPSSGEIPPDIKKKGAYAISQWLAANPEAARKISQSLR